MEITDVGVRLVDRDGERLKAVCTMTIGECFVVRDIKVVEGPNGLFVAMPSRKRRVRCGKCSHKNELRSSFCNRCGTKQVVRERPAGRTSNDRPLSHSDIAHPINSDCREMIQTRILHAYEEEFERNGVHEEETVEVETREEVQEVQDVQNVQEGNEVEVNEVRELEPHQQPRAERNLRSRVDRHTKAPLEDSQMTGAQEDIIEAQGLNRSAGDDNAEEEESEFFEFEEQESMPAPPRVEESAGDDAGGFGAGII